MYHLTLSDQQLRVYDVDFRPAGDTGFLYFRVAAGERVRLEGTLPSITLEQWDEGQPRRRLGHWVLGGCWLMDVAVDDGVTVCYTYSSVIGMEPSTAAPASASRQ